MKYKLMFLVLLTFMPSLSYAKDLTVTSIGQLRDQTVLVDYGVIIKYMNVILCTKEGSGHVDVYYNHKRLGACGTSKNPADGFAVDDVTSGNIQLSFYNTSLPSGGKIEINLYERVAWGANYQRMGNQVFLMPSMKEYVVSLADSVSFPALKTRTTQRQPLVNVYTPGWFDNSIPGKVTIKPSKSQGNLGIIQDGNNQNQIAYTVEGATWDTQNSQWVLKSSEQSVPHDLVINPDQSAIEGGNYIGYVTVTLSSE